MNQISLVQKELFPLKKQLTEHPVYINLKTIKDVRVFMEHHVFAVWDFMSLLKALQQKFTCVSVPWFPVGNPKVRRLINQIVADEESDLDKQSNPASHFELYVNAMKECGACTQRINDLLGSVKNKNILTYLNSSPLPDAIKSFLYTTFNIIERGKSHEIAAAFTFGREDLIPDMFSSVLRDVQKSSSANLDAFIYYLDRHIELDSDEHSPLAMKMIEELCENDSEKWADILTISKLVLNERIKLWDAINSHIRTPVCFN